MNFIKIDERIKDFYDELIVFLLLRKRYFDEIIEFNLIII